MDDFAMGLLAFTGSIGSAILIPAEKTLSLDFGVGYEVSVLTLSLFVLGVCICSRVVHDTTDRLSGFALGPIFWAPISEAYGRRWAMLPAVFVLGLFSIGTARSNNVAALLLTRFFGGIFGSAPISNVSAALGDIFPPQDRAVAQSFYSICVVGGPTVAPIIAASINANPHLGWRC